MLIRRPSEIPSSEITDELLFWNRRSFIKAAGLGAAAVTCSLVAAISGHSVRTLNWCQTSQGQCGDAFSESVTLAVHS